MDDAKIAFGPSLEPVALGPHFQRLGSLEPTIPARARFAGLRPSTAEKVHRTFSEAREPSEILRFLRQHRKIDGS